MYELKSDAVKNRIYLKMVGFFNLAQTRACADAVIAEVAKVRPGFDFVTDIGDFKPVVQEAVAEIARAQAAIAMAGVRRVVRISAKDASVTSMQFSRAQREAGIGYQTAIVKSLAEAEKLLA